MMVLVVHGTLSGIARLLQLSHHCPRLELGVTTLARYPAQAARQSLGLQVCKKIRPSFEPKVCVYIYICVRRCMYMHAYTYCIYIYIYTRPTLGYLEQQSKSNRVEHGNKMIHVGVLVLYVMGFEYRAVASFL